MFREVKDQFQTTRFWERMANEFENSPYHQEANVAVHTEMVLNQLEQHSLSGKTQLLAQLACLFHDAGKPVTKTEKHSAERGKYVSYAGHALTSARTMERFFHENPQLLVEDKLGWKDVYAAMFLIERHQDHSVEKTSKLVDIRTSLEAWGAAVDADLYSAYKGMMVADCAGRITVSQGIRDQITEKTTHYLKELDKVSSKTLPTGNSQAYVLVGPSGSGKSTWKKAQSGMLQVSLDDFREMFAKQNGVRGQYADFYAYCLKNEAKFSAFVQHESKKVFQGTKPVIVDNTNLTKKTRAKWLYPGYQVTAVMFPRNLDLLIQRQATRGDKNVPEAAVKQQYFSLQIPWLGVECSNLVVVE